MDLRLLSRPTVSIFSGRTSCLFAANALSRRNESSYRRTKKRLNVKPEASFVPSKSSSQQDHIVFNPPASAPSVLHTPLKFLPKNDPRRKIFASPSNPTMTQTARPNNGTLPPELWPRPANYQRHHLSEQDVEEIRRLKTANPDLWTSQKLAKKFNCSVIFISMCVKATDKQLEAEREKLEAIKARWGPKRTAARSDRKRRWEAVTRDE